MTCSPQAIQDLLWISAGVGAALVVLALTWNKLLTITLHQELAQVEGLAVGKIRLLLMLLIATVIAS